MNSLLDVISQFSRYEKNQITFRLYGTRAEDLNCRGLPNEIGDRDIMIFPTSDNLIIYDEMIEYLPKNAMHVRIKGVDQPVLQSCLVEDTEYVTTSALKNLHPSIYGNAADALKAMTTQEITELDFFTQCTKNSITSPAATLSFNIACSPADVYSLPTKLQEVVTKRIKNTEKWNENLNGNQTEREEERPPLTRITELTSESLHAGPRISDVSKQDKQIPRNNEISIGSVAETTPKQVKRGGF